MKKVREKRPVNEIINDAKKQDFSVDATQYSEGRDSIALMKKYSDTILVVGYDTSNGNFRGDYGSITFDNTTPSLQQEPRMKTLFDLFYLPPKRK